MNPTSSEQASVGGLLWMW